MNAPQSPQVDAHPSAPRPTIGTTAFELLTALSMIAGRGAAARAVAEAAGLTADDHVVDVGCGPGTAVRLASRSVAAATGVDPSPMMLSLARRISALQRLRRVSWVQGAAETLPLPDAEATVVWSVSSFHHWSDRSAGLVEAHRVLRPEGRLVIAERLTRPGARGHAAHGIGEPQAVGVTQELITIRFHRVGHEIVPAGRRTLVLITAVKPSGQPSA
jgi:ubiquinone/menaquinone biosynthesis C-methylase UbiE